MVGPKHHPVMTTRIDGCLQPRLPINHRVEVDVLLEHVPDIPDRTGFLAAVGGKLALMCDAGLDPAGEEGEGAAGVGEEDL